jgi:uncharacterized hydrophobic protein (TIGR00341 family)
MPFRMVEIVVPTDYAADIRQLLENQALLGVWSASIEESQAYVRALIPTEQTETVLDEVREHLPPGDAYRIMVFSVEATLPQPKPEERAEKHEQEPEQQPQRISREELYDDVTEGARLNSVYIVNVALSVIVAAIGLIANDVTAIIGAAILAPLIWPNLSFALAITLGDVELILQSLKTYGAGLLTTLLLAVPIGLLFNINPQVPTLLARTQTSVGSLVLALSAGTAGALALTSGVPARLIGVVMAVALLPPLVAAGMLVGSGNAKLALGALLLFLVNVASLNLASVITFLLRGIRPRTWWEAEQAKRATRIAISFWVLLLAILAAVILLSLQK